MQSFVLFHKTSFINNEIKFTSQFILKKKKKFTSQFILSIYQFCFSFYIVVYDSGNCDTNYSDSGSFYITCCVITLLEFKQIIVKANKEQAHKNNSKANKEQAHIKNIRIYIIQKIAYLHIHTHTRVIKLLLL